MAEQRNTLPGEIWKPLPDYEGRYEISSLGRVWSIKRPHPAVKTGRLVKGQPDQHGYPRIHVDRKSLKVHRLVLIAFCGAPEKGQVAAHLNGDPADPRLANLAWISLSENMAHKKLHGTYQSGSSHPGAKLSDEQVGELRKLRQARWSLKRLATRYGISLSAAYQAAVGLTYDNLNERYPPVRLRSWHVQRGDKDVDCDKPQP